MLVFTTITNIFILNNLDRRPEHRQGRDHRRRRAAPAARAGQRRRPDLTQPPPSRTPSPARHARSPRPRHHAKGASGHVRTSPEHPCSTAAACSSAPARSVPAARRRRGLHQQQRLRERHDRGRDVPARPAAAGRQRRPRQGGHHRLLGPGRPTTAGSPPSRPTLRPRRKKYSDVDAAGGRGQQRRRTSRSARSQTLIDKKVDALVILPFDGKALTEIAIKAMEAGIPVVNLDREFASPRGSRTRIGGDNYGMGVAAGTYIAATAQGQGREQPGDRRDPGHRQPAADPGPVEGLRRRAGNVCGFKVRNQVAAEFTVESGAEGHRRPAPGGPEDRRHLEPRRRPGHRRARRDRPGEPQGVLHGRRRRIAQRHGRHQGRRRRAQGDRDLPADAWRRRRSSSPASWRRARA